MAAPANQEALEHYYTQIENQNRFHCYERKDAAACHELADFIETKKKKYVQALEEYRKNCFDNDYGKSCYAFAELKYNGKREVEKDVKEATKAALRGCKVKRFSGPSCDVIGQFLNADKKPSEVTEVLGPKNVKEAGRMFARGCEDNNKFACSHAAQLYNREKDVKLAYKYAVKACELNSAVSCVMAAEACKNGIGTEKSERLYNYYNKRAEALNPGKGAKQINPSFS